MSLTRIRAILAFGIVAVLPAALGQTPSLASQLAVLSGRTFRCATPDWLDPAGDGFLRLHPATPPAVRTAWLAMQEGENMDLTKYATGYNIDLMKGLQQLGAKHGVGFNFTVDVVRVPGKEDPRKWSLNTAGYECLLSSTQLASDRAVVMDFMVPSIPYGYIVTTTAATTTAPAFSDRVTTFLQPFDSSVWACIVVAVAFSAVVTCLLEARTNSEDFPPPPAGSDWGREPVGPFAWHMSTALYRSVLSFVAYDVFRAQSGAGRLYVMVFSFVSMLLVSAYTANLAAFFTKQQGLPHQQISTINDFQTLRTQACLRNSGQAIDFMERKYPQIKTLVAANSQPALMDAILSGQCLGAVNTDLHTRYTLSSDDKYCDLQIVGQALSFGYYAIPFRKLTAAPNASANASAGPSTVNPVVAALNLLAAEFIESGGATDAASKHFPTDNVALCTARADAERWAKSQGGASDGNSISLADVSGLFILLSITAIVSLLISTILWARGVDWSAKRHALPCWGGCPPPGLTRSSPVGKSSAGTSAALIVAASTPTYSPGAVTGDASGESSGASTPQAAAAVFQAQGPQTLMSRGSSRAGALRFTTSV
ncbi:hypothetical protein HYH03_016898 [Edaphochlamys debaryana]|uniref:Ionotropic glutamate receptor C-terminal domain-containing protein n=1 Tax=Edaphochlamys debaryana TaxID=47281 RepID=A0A835XK22_9CHLO|nr:hypothetical protein HYH03_016898 [Edaphochlamys debaryana]|eukprot:KAG2484253.1 hypothetical protein HYH03_016898 [Edaphochlamys debaryana]